MTAVQKALAARSASHIPPLRDTMMFILDRTRWGPISIFDFPIDAMERQHLLVDANLASKIESINSGPIWTIFSLNKKLPPCSDRRTFTVLVYRLYNRSELFGTLKAFN